MGFKITVDLMDPDYSTLGTWHNQMPLYGIERAAGLDDSLPALVADVKFRLYDDDDELCYEGVLHDDDECINQQAALRWGESNAGCTTIKVWKTLPPTRGFAWVQEIG